MGNDLAFNLHLTHHYEALPGGGSQVRLTALKPYLRITHGKATLYVKEGLISGADGVPMQTIPDWLWEEARKVTPQARAEVKLVLPEERDQVPSPAIPVGMAESDSQRVAKKAEGLRLTGALLWKCDTCSEEMPFARKGLHIARHARAAKRTVETAGRV